MKFLKEIRELYEKGVKMIRIKQNMTEKGHNMCHAYLKRICAGEDLPIFLRKPGRKKKVKDPPKVIVEEIPINKLRVSGSKTA